MSIDPRDKFFPTEPTLADYDAAVKRAKAAEDHLAREVECSRSLQTALACAEALAAKRLEMRNEEAKKNDVWRAWASEVGGRPDWNGHDHELRALVMDRMSELEAESGRLREHKSTLIRTLTDAENELADARTEALARDAVIADLLAQVDSLKASAKARDAAFISELRADLNAEKTARQNGEGTNRNLLATLAARDAQIEDLRGQVATLSAQMVYRNQRTVDEQTRRRDLAAYESLIVDLSDLSSVILSKYEGELLPDESAPAFAVRIIRALDGLPRGV